MAANALPRRETAVMEVADSTLKLVAVVPPNLTSLTPEKLVMVTEVPPTDGPLLGSTLLTVVLAKRRTPTLPRRGGPWRGRRPG